MSDEYVEVQSVSELKEVIGRTTICILLATVTGRDAVNASAREEFDDCLETKARDFRTFATILGSDNKAELKEIGVDMGAEPFPKFVIFGDGEIRIMEDTSDVLLSDLITNHGQE